MICKISYKLYAIITIILTPHRSKT
jgi:hypothetical protein